MITALLWAIGLGLVPGVMLLVASAVDAATARHPGPVGQTVRKPPPLPEPRGPLRAYIRLDHARQARADRGRPRQARADRGRPRA